MTTTFIHRDTALTLVLATAALGSVAVLAMVVVSTLYGALPALDLWPEAIAGLNWAPGEGHFGMLAMLLASILAATLALAIAGPLSVLLAAWLILYAPWPVQRFLRALYELLAGIPSVVYGLWGLIVLVPVVNAMAPPGTSLLAAVLILALMILPYGTLIIESRLRQVPEIRKHSALATGLSRWGAFRAVYWPLAKSGAVTAMVLQFGRALGETMAVLMVAGNVVQLPDSLFAPVRTLTANIALEMGYAGDVHRAALYLSGGLLLLLTMVIMTLAREPGHAGD